MKPSSASSCPWGVLGETDGDTEAPVLAISGPPPSGPLALPQQVVTLLQTFSLSYLQLLTPSSCAASPPALQGKMSPSDQGLGGAGGAQTQTYHPRHKKRGGLPSPPRDPSPPARSEHTSQVPRPTTSNFIFATT